jgi:hypothetical protein
MKVEKCGSRINEHDRNERPVQLLAKSMRKPSGAKLIQTASAMARIIDHASRDKDCVTNDTRSALWVSAEWDIIP